jgi:putative Holliday junction resolvase
LSNSNLNNLFADDLPPVPESGRILSLDIGTNRVGVAVSDELRITIRALESIERTSWKKLLIAVIRVISEFDAKAVVLGLPLRLDGTEGDASLRIRRLYKNFRASLTVPVFLQDERLTSRAATEKLRAEGYSEKETKRLVDGEAAVLILQEFLSRTGCN